MALSRGARIVAVFVGVLLAGSLRTVVQTIRERNAPAPPAIATPEELVSRLTPYQLGARLKADGTLRTVFSRATPRMWALANPQARVQFDERAMAVDDLGWAIRTSARYGGDDLDHRGRRRPLAGELRTFFLANGTAVLHSQCWSAACGARAGLADAAEQALRADAALRQDPASLLPPGGTCHSDTDRAYTVSIPSATCIYPPGVSVAIDLRSLETTRTLFRAMLTDPALREQQQLLEQDAASPGGGSRP